jgi:hypothetical protein
MVIIDIDNDPDIVRVLRHDNDDDIDRVRR